MIPPDKGGWGVALFSSSWECDASPFDKLRVTNLAELQGEMETVKNRFTQISVFILVVLVRSGLLFCEENFSMMTYRN